MKYVICNLKANKTKSEINKYEKEVRNIELKKELELVICPSTPFLYFFEDSHYKLGAQDLSIYNQGSFTGETTADQLASLNVKYALIGHSERRNLFKEKESTIIEKIKRAYHNHIRPVYFIGETLSEKENNQTNIVLNKQIINVITEVPDYKREKMIIVYEPIWAIGSGNTPQNEDIANAINYIKEIIKTNYNIEIPILYGGSVSKKNISSLMNIKSLDGFVLGESSKEYEELNEIIEIIKKTI